MHRLFCLCLNVFDFEPTTEIKVTENGVELPVTQITVEDPLPIVAYEVPVFAKAGKVKNTDVTRPNSHMFEAKTATSDAPVVITVTDAYGRSFTKTLDRPGRYDAAM